MAPPRRGGAAWGQDNGNCSYSSLARLAQLCSLLVSCYCEGGGGIMINCHCTRWHTEDLITDIATEDLSHTRSKIFEFPPCNRLLFHWWLVFQPNSTINPKFAHSAWQIFAPFNSYIHHLLTFTYIHHHLLPNEKLGCMFDWPLGPKPEMGIWVFLRKILAQT